MNNDTKNTNVKLTRRDNYFVLYSDLVANSTETDRLFFQRRVKQLLLLGNVFE